MALLCKCPHLFGKRRFQISAFVLGILYTTLTALITAIAVFFISFRFSEDAAGLMAEQATKLMVEKSTLRVKNGFDRAKGAVDGTQAGLMTLPYATLPSENPEKNWHEIWQTWGIINVKAIGPQISAFLFTFEDGSWVNVAGVSEDATPYGPLNHAMYCERWRGDKRPITNTFSSAKTIDFDRYNYTTMEHLWGGQYNDNGVYSSEVRLREGYNRSLPAYSSVFSSVDVSGSNRVPMIKISFSLFNATRFFLGIGEVQLRLDTFDSMVQAQRITTNTQVVILSRARKVIASSVPNHPAIERKAVAQDYTLSAQDIENGCALTYGSQFTDKNIYCLKDYRSFDYEPIRVMGELGLIPSSDTKQIGLDPTRAKLGDLGYYFVAVIDYNLYFPSLDWVTVIVSPEDEILENIRQGKKIAAATTFAIMLFVSVVSGLMSRLSYRPLADIARKMKSSAYLRDKKKTTEGDIPKRSLSYVSDVAAIQKAYWDLSDELGILRSYIPQHIREQLLLNRSAETSTKTQDNQHIDDRARQQQEMHDQEQWHGTIIISPISADHSEDSTNHYLEMDNFSAYHEYSVDEGNNNNISSNTVDGGCERLFPPTTENNNNNNNNNNKNNNNKNNNNFGTKGPSSSTIEHAIAADIDGEVSLSSDNEMSCDSPVPTFTPSDPLDASFDSSSSNNFINNNDNRTTKSRTSQDLTTNIHLSGFGVAEKDPAVIAEQKEIDIIVPSPHTITAPPLTVAAGSRVDPSVADGPLPIFAENGLVERNIAVAVVNITDFHRYVTNTAPDTVVKNHENFVTYIHDVAKRHGGVLDSFNGDKFLVSFNASTPCYDRGIAAVLFAHEVAYTVNNEAHSYFKYINNNSRRPSDKPPLSPRRPRFAAAMRGVTIGAAVGRALVGSLGTHNIRRYTIISNAMSEAAALERMAMRYPGCGVLIGEEMIPVIEGYFQYLLLDATTLPGSEGQRKRIACVKGPLPTANNRAFGKPPRRRLRTKNPFEQLNECFNAFLEGKHLEVSQRLSDINNQIHLSRQLHQTSKTSSDIPLLPTGKIMLTPNECSSMTLMANFLAAAQMSMDGKVYRGPLGDLFHRQI